MSKKNERDTVDLLAQVSGVPASDLEVGAVRTFVNLVERRERERETARHFSRSSGGSVHGERANFARLVLGCIEAKFCK